MADKPAVIDMGMIDDQGDSFQNFEYTSQTTNERYNNLQENSNDQNNHDHDDGPDTLFGTAQATVTKMMWDAGKSKATKAWSIYGNIDLLRPYFDVEPRDVLKRTVQALIPKPPTATPIKVVTELYGPTMLVMTLIALLLYEMKSSGHKVQEGTLIGTSFGTCFGYWLGCGTFVWMTCYVSNTHLTFLQVISMMGYSLVADCIIVLLSTIIHTTHDHMLFYLLWGVFGGLTTLRMVSILISRTHGPSQKLIVSAVMAFLHLTFLIYLHFAYHQVVEEIDDIIQESRNDLKDALMQNEQKIELSQAALKL